MPGIHRQERHLGKLDAHVVGVVGRHAGAPQTLQEYRLEIDEGSKGATQIAQHITRTDPGTLDMRLFNRNGHIPMRRHALQPFNRQPSGIGYGPPHENGIFDLAIAIDLDNPLRVAEIGVRQPGLAFRGRSCAFEIGHADLPCRRPSGSPRETPVAVVAKLLRTGPCRRRVAASIDRRSGRQVQAPGRRSASDRNGCDSDPPAVPR